MKMIVDTDKEEVIVDGQTHKFHTAEAFRALSKAWIRSVFINKQVYTYTWMGRPIIQLPEDMFRTQEVIYALKPDVIIETGIAHGGSLIYYASLCKVMGKGRVIGIDIDIRPHNKKAILEHELTKDYITMIEASSIEVSTVEKVKAMIKPKETVFVILDANHTKDHVAAELRAYGELVTVGSYIVAADGIVSWLNVNNYEVFRSKLTNEIPASAYKCTEWSWNNPVEAVKEFVAHDKRFIIEQPAIRFNESNLAIADMPTYFLSGWVKRIK